MNSEVDFSRDDEKDVDEEPKVEPRKQQQAQDDGFLIRLNGKEKAKYYQYIVKYAEKLYKIYKRLNVKIVSKEVLKTEFDANKHLLQILDSVSGNFNKISNQITQLLQDNDNEV